MKPVLRKPFSDVVTTKIRTAILEGVLSPGSRIRQEDLATRLGVSRAPIREALVVLEREGLVQTVRWRGAVVATLDEDLIANIYEFRSAIDAYVASALASRSDFDPVPFRKLVASGRAAVSRPADLRHLIALDSQFHMGLYEALGNPVLVEVMRDQWSHLQRAMAATLSISGYPRQVWDEHAAILDAIIGRHGSAAARLAHTHTIDARTKLIAKLAPSTPHAMGSKGARGNGTDGRNSARKVPSGHPDRRKVSVAMS